MADRHYRPGLSWLLILSAVALAGCAGADPDRSGGLPPVSEKSPLTVMTFSIRMGLGRDNPHRDIARMNAEWGRNIDAVIDAIRSANPAIVGLQEVAGPDQLREIAQALDMNHAFVWHEAEGDPKPWWGVGILSKYPIITSEHAAMSDDRNFIVATIGIGPKKIAVANVHRSHLQSGEDSVPLVVAEMAKGRSPALIIGNFNSRPGDRPLSNRSMRRLQPVLDRFFDTAVQAQTKSADYARRAGTWHGGGRTDYVFAEKGRFAVVDASLVADRYRNASDHIAYVAKLIFTE